ncbi:MAG: DUF1611 domain-containing protein [Pseudomonadota bacterium]
MNLIDLKPPYLIFVGEEGRTSYAKTALGVTQWRRELCAGQLRLSTEAMDLGLPDYDIDAAVEAGAKSLIIGTASVGGALMPEWRPVLIEAARAGLNIIAGLHQRLSDDAELSAVATASGAEFVDVRVPPEGLPIATGKRRSGKRVLTVGTDCALGKKYTALQLEKDLKSAGANVDFRASGQTGIMIAGRGIPIDAVVSDFLAGAAEVLSPANSEDHWDVIEGQGALLHPAYGAVSYGLLIGSQPDALVVCHAAGRETIASWPEFPLPEIGDVIDRNIEAAKLTNPAPYCAGISVNTSALNEGEREEYLHDLEQKYQLPCVDPLIHGTSRIVERLLS